MLKLDGAYTQDSASHVVEHPGSRFASANRPQVCTESTGGTVDPQPWHAHRIAEDAQSQN